jgi:hypothetical protein
MYPHERSLVKKNQDRPFAMIGINSDPNPEAAENIVTTERLPWRNIYEGGPINKPIAMAWNVSAWPQIYFIDAKGTIRFRNLRGEAATQTIEYLLSEQEGIPYHGVDPAEFFRASSVMWSGTPRSIIRTRRNRRLPGHTGWCLNTTDSEELEHTTTRHIEVANRNRAKMDSMKAVSAP